MNAADIRPSRVLAGVFFTLTGCAFLLQSLGVWTLDLVYLWPLLLVGIGIAFLVGRARTKRREESRSATLAVAEERVRIARELHDVVAHGVSLMTVQIAAARRVAQSRPEASAQALEAAEEAGRQSLAELRNLLGVLRSADDSLGQAARSEGLLPEYGPRSISSTTASERPGVDAAPTAPLPRLDDIPALVENLRAAGLDVRLDVVGTRASNAGPGVDLASYRVVQESLTNALRHAPGAHVEVEVSSEPDGIQITVSDDGNGVLADRRAVTGHGLLGMRERVAASGGTLVAGPRLPEPGWRVHATFPASPRRG